MARQKHDYILHLENVRKCYGKKVVLDDIDLAVQTGEFCTVVGPSGCGKSTLLRIILGQERVTDGSVSMNGESIRLPGPDRGIVYQKYSLFPHLTILENIMLGKQLNRSWWSGFTERKVIRDEALHYLTSVKLDGHAEKYPHELSGGMQQRVAIAQALIMKPRILLMDEPFGALDPGTRESMQVLILQLWEEQGMTIFFVTHDLEEAVFLGTRILVLSQFYTHETGSTNNHGARIVSDYQLKERRASSLHVKQTEAFGKFIETIRYEGFDPEVLQHATAFNLKHKDSFITLKGDEKSEMK